MNQQEEYKKPENFRDKVSTIGEKGKRLWVFPRKPKGTYTNVRTIFSWFQLLILFCVPFIKIGGQPLLMLNILERKFVILGQVFWPQDFYLFALLLIAFFISIILFTAVWGRVWCGWLCPQTIFMEMLFRKVEYLIEGNHRQQKALSEAPWNRQKILKKGTKGVIFFGLSWLIANTFLAYIIGGDALIELITDDPQKHLSGLTAMVIFTLAFFSLYIWFREQFCTFLCPYARLQSVMLDDNSIGVAYDYKRGEPRAKRKARKMDKEAHKGDCVDCGICQQVCPTGIDIRNGFPQLECINCTACIDACNTVMKSVKKPPGLIRYASINMIENNSKFTITPRVMIYSTLLMALVSFCGLLLLLRQDIDINLLRERGFTYQVRPDARISNFYTAMLSNKASTPVQLKISCQEGEVIMVNKSFVPANKVVECKFFVVVSPEKITESSHQVTINMTYSGEIIYEEKISFLVPKKGINK